jgi:primosomal protein N' (replication factor Y)
MKPLIAEVILPLPPDRTFSYSVPLEFADEAVQGRRVVVQFGNQKVYTGVIKAVHENMPEYKVKDIMAVMDDKPIISQQQLDLWEWIAEYYMCSEGEVMSAALPGILKLQSETFITINEELPHVSRILTPDEQKILDILNDGPELSIQDLARKSGSRAVIVLIQGLIDEGVLVTRESVRNRYKEPEIEMVKMRQGLYESDEMRTVMDGLEKKAPRQFELLMHFLTLEQEEAGMPVPKKKLMKRSGASSAVFRELEKKNILENFSVLASSLATQVAEKVSTELSVKQRVAFDEINDCFSSNKPVMLHGVTASGKTEIYTKLISQTIAKGKQVLYLLPEIALTTQIISRMRKSFGESVLLYHSRHSQRERADVYMKVLRDGDDGTKIKFPLVVGARSAVLLPFRDLGLIIVDEEHEISFKQFDPAPRYQARDAAIVLGGIHKSDVLLGSATPSLESYQNAVSGKYSMVTLDGRFGGAQAPEMILVDLVEALKRRQVKNHFTNMLIDEMRNSLEKGEQVILFQNRRGFAPVLQCGNCGWIPQCINCDVSLTYHKNSNSLRCHYCGYNTPSVSKCGECKSHNVKMKGLGTERIEDDVKVFFPDARVERLDLDTSGSKQAFQRILNSFEHGEIDILVGTQMITKGLDFSNVGLVGVLNADNLLNFPDFRASERSFQLLAQVAGRAGRRQHRGRVLIQTYRMEHPVLQFLTRYDYEGFFKYESHERKLYHYPPFYRLIEFRLRHRNEAKLESLSRAYAVALKNVFGNRMLGPVIPSVSRIRNYHLRTILLKVEKGLSNRKLKSAIHEVTEEYRKDQEHRQLLIQIDVDPY